MGSPTYMPKMIPMTLIIANLHKWGQKVFLQNLPISSHSHQPGSNPEVGLGVNFFLCFSTTFEFSTKFSVL